MAYSAHYHNATSTASYTKVYVIILDCVTANYPDDENDREIYSWWYKLRKS